MNVACDQCQSKFNIPDEKIPAGKAVTFKCPKCENRITLGGADEKVAAAPAATSDARRGSGSTYAAEDKPFSFLEEGAKTALICEPDAALREQIKSVLAEMGYHMTEAEDARNALKNMRYHIYDLIVVNELFGTHDPNANGVLIYLERLGMSTRRNIFVSLLSSRFKTMDQMMAFNKSVNLIINLENMDSFDKILKRGIRDNEAFYRVFNETMKKLGRV